MCNCAVGRITGDVRVNGHPQSFATFARVSGYVEQTDIHSPHTTVREAVQFSARLRLPPLVDDAALPSFVDEVSCQPFC